MSEFDEKVIDVEAQLARIRVDAEAIWEAPPPLITSLLKGMGRAGAGPIPQVFTTWGLLREDSRWISQHALPFLIATLREGASHRKVHILASSFFSGEVEQLRWLGEDKLADFLVDLTSRLNAPDGDEDVVTLAIAIEIYAHLLQFWTTHYFPWGVGTLFPKTSDSYGQHAGIGSHNDRGDGLATSARVGDSESNGAFVFKWPSLGAVVRGAVLAGSNEALIAAIRDQLPLRGFASHSVTSGLDLTMWLPIFSTVGVDHLESIDDMPVGRVFATSSGGKLLIKYGPQTEWVKMPTIAQVGNSDLDTLSAVGRRVWESIFFTKELIPMEVSYESPR